MSALPGEAAFVREIGSPSVSEHERALIVPGSIYHNRALASVKGIEDKEADAKYLEEQLAIEARELKALTDAARSLWQ